MKWKKLSLETTVAAEDILAGLLESIGIEGVQIEDKIPITEEEKKAMFIDILPELPPDDGVAVLSFYAEMDADIDELIANVKAQVKEASQYVDVGSGRIEVSETEDVDWINNWKEYFKPFRVDEDIVIKPTWTELTDRKDTDMVIEIDPGTAFGTGAHETTKLVIMGIKKYLKKGQSLFDIGCGSGILSIIGKKLGADRVLGIDIDESATATAIENAGVNGLSEQDVEYISGNVIDDKALRDRIGEKFDMVVANILADIIIPLSGVVKDFCKPDTLFISSGIINTKEQQVKEALDRNGFELVDTIYLGDWVSIVARPRN